MIDYTHPRRVPESRPAQPARPAGAPVILRRGETIILTGPRAGTVERR